MLKVCSDRRYRLISLEGDPTFNRAVEELRQEGPADSKALATLIDKLLTSRCAEIQDVLRAASRISPDEDLLGVIKRVISAPPIMSVQLGASRFPPVIVGGGRIEWDATATARIKETASAALNALVASGATGPKSKNMRKIPTQKRRTQNANIISVTCSKCHNEYRPGVDAAVVSDDGMGEDFGAVIGSYTGGASCSPDLVTPLTPGRQVPLDTLKEITRLERIRSAGTSRYWQGNLCKTAYPYPWVR
jgi:hypothetical protein